MSTEKRLNELLDDMEKKFKDICEKYSIANTENMILKIENTSLKQKIKKLEGR